MSRSINRSEFPKLDKWLTAIEGSLTPQSVEGTDVRCDFCQSVIEPGERFTSYLADSLVNEDIAGDADAPFYFLRAYCPSCDRQTILNPCQGYLELLLEGELDSKKRLTKLDLLDFSGSEEGIAYDPQELWEVGHGRVSWSEFQRKMTQLKGHPVRLGPADIADDYLFHGINPRDVYDTNGEITLTESERTALAEKFRKRRENSMD